MSLLSTDSVCHGAVGAGRSILKVRETLMGSLVLLLLKVVLPIVLLPLCVHGGRAMRQRVVHGKLGV